MNALHKFEEKVIRHFHYVLPYLKVPSNEKENQQLIGKARTLKMIAKRNNIVEINELLNLIYKNIQEYETRAYPIKHSSPADILKYLMEQHELTQKDLPEIGTQSHVSKILNGERNLTADQIGILSKRFHVSPAIFY